MPSKVTVTAKTGPDKTATSLVLNNVTDINFQIDNQILKVTSDQGVREFDLYTVATVTYTIASRQSTVTVST